MQTNFVRPALEEDLPAIIRLTRENRALLARLEPTFWRAAADADESHAAFMATVVTNPDITKRVLEKDGRVIGFVVSLKHPAGWWFIDDVCLAEEADWSTDGVDLLKAIEERPAAMTAPHKDEARIRAAAQVGLELVSTFRSIRFDQDQQLDLAHDQIEPGQPPATLVASPFHVFGPAMTPESISFIGDGLGGYAVLSPSLPVPPIYDVGGKVSVIDRVVADDRERVLLRGLSFAAQRGDVGVILIASQVRTTLLMTHTT